MARALPDGWDTPPLSLSAAGEIETLRSLASGLPDGWCVYHGVHWTKVNQGYSLFGEVDFVVCGPEGQVVLIEQKRGPLEETPEGLVKRYSDKAKRVCVQMQRSIDGLQARFSHGHHGRRLVLDYLLYCPDYRICSPATAGVAPERIVDARRPQRLCEVVVAMVQALAHADGPKAEDVHAFLADELQLAVDPGALQGSARRWVTRLSGGLATWARQLEFDPFRLRVVGTAGSGKTQLALRVLEDAAKAGRRALYVCFNRPLADRIAELAPATTNVATFHMLGDQILQARGMRPDFGAPGVFDRLAEAFLGATPSSADLYDVLVVDEGQDFSQPWADGLLRWLRPDGSAWWLEDPMQNLYGKPDVDLPGWVRLHADTNYRTPRDILLQIGRITRSRDVEAGSPVEGGGIDVRTYSDFRSLVDATTAAIREAKALGFRDDDIAVITYPGRDRSQFTGFDAVGGISLRRFDGTYDAGGHPMSQPGDILIETVFRFKGQSAPCVILTEVDFDDLDLNAERRLYVGATRATQRLSLVISERSAQRMVARLD